MKEEERMKEIDISDRRNFLKAGGAALVAASGFIRNDGSAGRCAKGNLFARHGVEP